MIKIYTFFLVLAINSVFAQNVVFNDPDFKALFIKPWYDTNNDGELSFAEATAITSFSATTNVNINDLQGIEAFTNLQGIVIKNNNVSAPVDLTQNLNLKTLILWGSMTVLNITGLNQLEYISVDGPFPVLDVINKPLLHTLFIDGAYVNGSTTPVGVQQLNVAGSPLLTTLWSQGTSLTSLNLLNNSLLTQLVINGNQLTGIDLTGNPMLNYLSIGGNPMTTLNVTQNPLLESLFAGNMGITSINLQNNSLLKVLSLSYNIMAGGTIDISNLTVLEDLDVFGCQLTSLDLTNNVSLKYLDITNNYLPDMSFSNLSQLLWWKGHSNNFTSVDLSSNPVLNIANFGNNQLLEYINLKNGNNDNMQFHYTMFSWLPLLKGVCVDNSNSGYANSIRGTLPSTVIVTSNCAWLGTEELAVKSITPFYPNPSAELVYFKSSSRPLLYEIYAPTGQKVDAGKFRSGENSIKVSHLTPGTYMVKVETEKGTLTGKVIKK